MSKATRYIIIYLVTVVTVCAYATAGYFFDKNNEPLWHVTPDQQALMSKSLSNANSVASAFNSYSIVTK